MTTIDAPITVVRHTINAPITTGRYGKSAYQAAVDAGFIGTVEEWLSSLAAYGTPIPTTRDAINNLALAGGMKPGRRYILTYQARFVLPRFDGPVEGIDPPGWDGVVVGAAETLIVTARNGYELEPVATSVEHPDDHIEYSLSNATFAGGQSLTGCITRRIWAGGRGRKIDTDYDWRALKCRVFRRLGSLVLSSPVDEGAGHEDLYAIPLTCRLAVGEGVLTGPADGLAFAPGDGESPDRIVRTSGSFLAAGYLPGHALQTDGATTGGNNLPPGIYALTVTDLEITITPGTLVAAEPFGQGTTLTPLPPYDIGELVHRTHHDGQTGAYDWPWAIWQQGVYKGRYDEGNDFICHVAPVVNHTHGCCSAMFTEGSINSYRNMPGAGIFWAVGDLDRVSADANVDRVDALSRVAILASYPGWDINGAQDGVTFGEEPLGPELVTVTRFDQPESLANWPGGVIDAGLLVFDGTAKIVREAAPIVAVPGGTYDIVVIAPGLSYGSGSQRVDFGGVEAFTVNRGGLWRKRIVAETSAGLELHNIDMVGGLYLVSARRVGGVEVGRKLVAEIDLSNGGAQDLLEVLLEDLLGDYVIEARNVTSESGGINFAFGSTTKPEVCTDPSFDAEPGAERWGSSLGGFAGGVFTVVLPPEEPIVFSQAAGVVAVPLVAGATYTGTLTLLPGFPADMVVRWRVGDGAWRTLVAPAAGDNILSEAVAGEVLAAGVQVELSSGTGGPVSGDQFSVRSIPVDPADGLHYEATTLNMEGAVQAPSLSLSNDSTSFATTIELYNMGHPTIPPHCKLFLSQFTQGYGATPYLVHDYHAAAWFGVDCDLLRIYDDQGLTHFLTGTLQVYKVTR